MPKTHLWWPQQITNEQLLDHTIQDPANVHIKKRAWEWIGHTLKNPTPAENIRLESTRAKKPGENVSKLEKK